MGRETKKDDGSLYRDFFDSAAAIPMAVVNSDGVMEYFNRKGEETFGYLHSEVPDLDHWWRLAYPDDRYREEAKTSWLALVDKARRGSGEIEGGEYQVTCKDGSVKVCRFFGSVVRGKTFIMLEDISARFRTERALRESEARLWSILDNSPVPMAIQTVQGKIEYFNAKYTQTYGYCVADTPDRETWTVKAAPDEKYRAELVSLFNEAFAAAAASGGQLKPLDFLFTCKNGEVKNVSISGMLLGEQIFAIFEDITERFRAMEALRGSEALLRRIIEQAPIAMAIVAMDGAIEYINRKAELVFGFPHADIPNMDRWWAQAYPDEAYRKEVIARYMGHVYEALEKGGEIAGEEYLVTCKDGSKKTCYIYGVIAGGKVFVMFDDISARVEAEKALRASETDLRRTLEQAPVSIAIHALDGNIEFINRKFIQTFGYKPEDIPTLGDWVRQAYPEEGYRKRLTALWNAWMEKSVHTGLEMEGIEVQLTCKDGTVKTVYVTGTVTPGKKVIALLEDITARVEAEKALRERESLYRSLIETTGTGYVVLDGGGKVLDANREYVRLSGHADLKDIMGRSVLDWSAPRSQARAREAVEIVVRDGRVSNFEVEYVDKAGKSTTIELNATAVSRSGVQQILGLCRDVSARSKTEAQLRESESLYRALIETTGTGYVVADSDFKVVDANAEYARLAGYSKVSEIIGRSILDWTAPEFKERNTSGLRKCFREGRLLNFEVDYQGKTGRITPVEGSVTIVSRNGVPHILSLCRDVTERKNAEARLRDSESLYRALVETTGTGYVVISREGTVLDANQEYVRLSGHSDLKEIIGRPVTDWTAPDKVGENAAAVAECAMNGHIFNFETDYINRDGARTPIEINATVVERAGIPRIHTICRDITQRRKDAADLKALNQDLEKRVQERTAELTKANVDLSQEIAQRMEAERERGKLQQELIQSQKMEVVGRLSAGIAHDFNNILVAISGYAEFLIQTLPEGAQAREDLGEIVRETERGAMLTRQLMAIGRKQPVELKVLSVNAVAGDSARMLKRLVGSNMNLETRLDPGAGQIKADAGQVSQVLMNLVVNARDAMSEGGKLIISTGNEEITERQPPMCLLPSPGKYVTVSVSDTGTGMEPETVCRIFDPFFTTKAEGKGTGLGLSTVYGIVHQSGGGIDVKTAPGQGTTFKIYFPRA